jgi:hypothetical protein
MQPKERCITQANGWRFLPLSVLIDTAREGPGVEASLSSPGTHTVAHAFEAAAARQGADFVHVSPPPVDFVFGANNQDITDSYIAYILEQHKKLKEEGKGLILGLSLWGPPSVLNSLHITKSVKQKTQGDCLVVFGGPAFPRRDEDWEKFFLSQPQAQGPDFVTIGGVGNAADLFSGLGRDDRFFRHPDGSLSVDTQNPALQTLVETRVIDSAVVYVPPSIISHIESIDVSVYIPGSGCAHKCSFCGITDDERGNRNQTGVSPEQAAQDLNTFLGETKGREKVYLSLINPNPLQNSRALMQFLNKVDFSRVESINIFADDLSLHLPKGLQKHKELIDFLKRQGVMPVITLALDAVDWENDGQFLGRRMPGVPDEEQAAAFAKMREGFKELRQWAHVNAPETLLAHNTIVSPSLGAKGYLQRATLIDLSAGHNWFVLTPYPATKLAAREKGNYADPIHMQQHWHHEPFVPSSFLSVWRNQHQNGDLLDCFVLLNMMHYYIGNQEKRYYHDLFLDMCHALAGQENPNASGQADFVQKVCDLDEKGIPKIIPVYAYCLDQVLGDIARNPEHEGNMFALGLMHNIATWLARREYTLYKNNPKYEETPQAALIIDKICDFAAICGRTMETMNRSRALERDSGPP